MCSVKASAAQVQFYCISDIDSCELLTILIFQVNFKVQRKFREVKTAIDRLPMLHQLI